MIIRIISAIINTRKDGRKPFVITSDNNLITFHRIGWITWIYQIIKRTGQHISETKSVKIWCPATSWNNIQNAPEPCKIKAPGLFFYARGITVALKHHFIEFLDSFIGRFVVEVAVGLERRLHVLMAQALGHQQHRVAQVDEQRGEGVPIVYN